MLPPTLLLLVAWPAVAVAIRRVDDLLLASSLHLAYSLEPHVHRRVDVGVQRLAAKLLHLPVKGRHLVSDKVRNECYISQE